MIARDTMGPVKVVAHLCQVVAIYFVYKAFIEVGLKRPYDLLFRSLKQSEESLAHSEAELKEAQRVARVGSWELTWETGDLVWSEELYRIFARDPKLPPPAYQAHRDIFTAESFERLDAAVKPYRGSSSRSRKRMLPRHAVSAARAWGWRSASGWRTCSPASWWYEAPCTRAALSRSP